MRIKSIAITNRVVSEEIDTKIRKCISDFIEENVSKMKTEEFIREVIDGKLQQRLRKVVSKIYPLRQFEFRKTEIM